MWESGAGTAFLSQAIWLWEHHKLAKITLYSLQSIPDAPVTATADKSGDKSPADHK